MNWTEITVNVPLEFTDTAAAIANMTVPYGIYIEDYSDLETEAVAIAHIDLIDEELLEKDKNTALYKAVFFVGILFFIVKTRLSLGKDNHSSKFSIATISALTISERGSEGVFPCSGI